MRVLGHCAKSFIYVIAFAFVTYGICGVFIMSYSDMFAVVPLFTGAYFGLRLAKKTSLPSGFAARYWPLLTPIVLALALRIYSNIAFEGVMPYRDNKLTLILIACYAPLLFFFWAGIPPEKKLTSTWLCWPTLALIAVLFAVLQRQTKTDFENTIRQGYSSEYATTLAGADDEVIANSYWPWTESNRMTKLDKPASLVLSGDYPVIDGATSFVPIYSALANETYQVADKNELQKYIACSKTSGAYSKLISGDADMIFVFQPSDDQLAAAKNAGVELRLTPIAKEAFVFFVNKNNPVSDLSIEQIQNIYLKKTTYWHEVGGSHKKILPFQRPENSGSQTVMLKKVMKDKKLPPPLQNEYARGMGGILREAAVYRDQEESIGYSFRFFSRTMVRYDHDPRDRKRRMFAYPEAEPVKLLSVNGVAPTEENIGNGIYPFTEDVYAVTAGTPNQHAGQLINWLLSPQGQELIEKIGYVKVKGI